MARLCSDRSAERLALPAACAAIDSFDAGVDEFTELIPRRCRSSAFSARNPFAASTYPPGPPVQTRVYLASWRKRYRLTGNRIAKPLSLMSANIAIMT